MIIINHYHQPPSTTVLLDHHWWPRHLFVGDRLTQDLSTSKQQWGHRGTPVNHGSLVKSIDSPLNPAPGGVSIGERDSFLWNKCPEKWRFNWIVVLRIRNLNLNRYNTFLSVWYWCCLWLSKRIFALSGHTILKATSDPQELSWSVHL